MSKVKLTAAQHNVLATLEWANCLSAYPSAWVRPMDLGATDGSSHSATLSALARKNLVERKQRGADEDKIGEGPRAFGMSRGSWEYRITDLGRVALAEHEAKP